MRFAHFEPPASPVTCLGVVLGEEVFDVRVAWRLGLLEVALSNSLTETLCENLRTGAFHALADALRELPPGDFDEWRHALADVRLLAPLQPRSFRDFYAFEAHVRSARARRGLPMLTEWYEQPVFYFSSTACIVGPGVSVRRPPDTSELDFELEMAAVIGREGGDIPPEEADDYIAGFTVLNDWSARDLQRCEMKVGLGPAKGKDFATSIGPYLVTPDELEDCILSEDGRGRRYDLEMTAQVNGREVSRGNARDMRWTFAELVAQASRNTVVRPGDLIGSGTVGTGCLLEFPEGVHPWLAPGDTVRLEIERLGALENTVAE